MLPQAIVAAGAKRSCIRDLFEYGLQRAKEVGSENVYDYSLGNPSVPAPQEVAQAIEELIHLPDSTVIHGYTPAVGAYNARAAIAEDLNARYHARIQPHHLFLTCGAAPALMAAFSALNLGDSEFVLLAPFFPEYPLFVDSAGGKAKIVAASEDFSLPLAHLSEAITEKTQAVVVNSPNNPSGVVYSAAELTQLAAILEEKSRQFGHPIYLIADEPYRELVYDGVSVPFLPLLYRNTVVCYSWSKSLSLPGERIGYVLVTDEADDAVDLRNAVAGAARRMGHVCAPSLLQQVIARCAAVRPDVAAYDKNRQTLYRALTGFGYTCVRPQGAFYMLVKAPDGDSAAFSQRAKQENLLIVPGDGFGCPAYCRLSTCVSHDMILRSLPAFQRLWDSYAAN